MSLRELTPGHNAQFYVERVEMEVGGDAAKDLNAGDNVLFQGTIFQVADVPRPGDRGGIRLALERAL